MTLDIDRNIEKQEEMDLEDQLSCLTADLIEYKKNKMFLNNLFNVESGQWTDINTLCQGINHLQNQLELIEKSCDEQLTVTWLDYPLSTMGEGYCLIIFYLESLHWDNIALYNRKDFI
ncbi:hypothetical protein [Cyanothece sp. BG0011]|uniref:hypothetical protein n=1 Tax=Cyanothece sp. BG0011 TaxID=2082950 RepID=UPI000D1F4243|nr:hypothetical protein [Cyanothece sp. BG0011]